MKSLLQISALFCMGLTASSAVTMADMSTPAIPIPDASALQESEVATPSPREQPSTAAFARMPQDEVQSLLLQWLAQARPGQEKAQQITALWIDKTLVQNLSAEDTLDRLIDSFAIADDSVKAVVESGRTNGTHETLNFEGVRSDAFFKDQVQLYQARWLTQHRFFDEALPILESLNPESSVDPASLFFYRAVCRLRLLQPEPAADDLTLLLNNTLDVPVRFRTVAELMQEEAGGSSEGLPQVARLMSDVQRRLDLGRADDPVQKREDEVIAALDKLLKDMEEQQKQQQQQSGQGGGQAPGQPGGLGASQSTIQGVTADGEADRKDLTENGSWGMLDKQAEAQARELIRQQFPSNFLDAISRYTRRIAEQKK